MRVFFNFVLKADRDRGRQRGRQAHLTKASVSFRRIFTTFFARTATHAAIWKSLCVPPCVLAAVVALSPAALSFSPAFVDVVLEAPSSVRQSGVACVCGVLPGTAEAAGSCAAADALVGDCALASASRALAACCNPAAQNYSQTHNQTHENQMNTKKNE